MPARSTIIFRTPHRYLRTVILKFSNNAFETAEFWLVVGLTAILRLLQRKNSPFFLICSFYCRLVKEG